MFSSFRRLCTSTAALTLAIAQSAYAQLPAADRDFVTKAVQGNNYELAAAQLASSLAQDPAIKAYAQMMISDHSVLASQLKMAVNAADPEFPMPTGMAGVDQAQLELLRNAAKKFDSTYKAQMITSHATVQAFFQAYVDGDKSNGRIKTVIAGALPTVQKHIDSANGLPGIVDATVRRAGHDDE